MADDRAALERKLLAKRVAEKRAAQGGSMDARAEEYINAQQADAKAVASGFADMITAGHNDELGALITAPFFGHDAGLSAARQFKNEAQGGSPGAYALGQGAGLAVPLKAGQAVTTNLLERGMSPWLAAPAVGGAEGYVMGHGNENADDATSTLFGAALGLLGESGGRTLKAGKDFMWPSKEVTDTALATDLFGATNTRQGGGINPDDLVQRARELGPQAIGADLHPALRAQTMAAVTEGADDASIGALARATEARDIPTMADESFLDVFGDPGTRAASRETRLAARDQLAGEYERVLQHHDATPSIDMVEVAGAFRNAFESGVTPTGTRARVMRDVQNLLNAKGQSNERGRFTQPLITLRDAVDLQHEIDAMIARIPADTAADPALAVNKLVRSDLIAARRNLSDILKSTDDDFRAVSAEYAGENEIADAGRMAQQVFSAPNSQLAADAAVYYNQLSRAAQENFRATATYEIARKAAGSTPLRAIQRAAGTSGGDALADTVRIVFGDQTASRLMQNADRLGTMQATNVAADAARQSREVGEVKLEEGGHLLKQGVDLFTVLTQAGTGRLNSGPFAGSARRGIAELGTRGPAAVNTSRVRLGASSGADLESELYRLLLLSRDRPSAARLNYGVLGGVPNTEQ